MFVDLHMNIIKYSILVFLILPLYAEVDYNSEIQPIFNSSCINCHSGSDAEEDLNLTSYNNVMNGGESGDVVIPYDHANSLLWQYVNSSYMPPYGSGSYPLTTDQINLIAQWIDEGALLESNECNLTTEDILGPYFFEGAPLRTVIAHPDEPGQRLFISGRILQNDCESPISGAMLEVWHPNDAGCYSIVEDCPTGNPTNDYYNLRGKMFSDLNGQYNFETILPGYYEPRPRHIHIKITTPNEEVLVSQLYFEDDPFCESDPWCQDANDRIISLEENEFGLYGEMEFIMNSISNGIIPGDINFDNLINVQDILFLVGIILNNIQPNDFQVYAANINGDTEIDILDIVQLVNIILNN